MAFDRRLQILGAEPPPPRLFLSITVAPSSPAESIISDYVSVRVFTARLSPAAAATSSSSSSSLCGPEAQHEPHYADPLPEHLCCGGTALQTALSLTFLLNCVLTTRGEIIIPDKTLSERRISMSLIMITCEGLVVSLCR